MPEVGILIIDDDVASQRALKLILDAEGWRVRNVAQASQAMAELASGSWDLAIVNAALLDMGGAVFSILKELSQAEIPPAAASITDQGRQGRRFRVLFLVPLMGSKDIPLILEREGLPYAFKPYHLHDFLQKVNDLLLESGAIAQAIRSVDGFERKKRRRDLQSRESQAGKKMFASREDYQMTEEEIVEYERQEREEAERKKRGKQQLNREPL